MRMPFGKHRGQLVSELPDDYLFWLFENVDLRNPLKMHISRRVTEIRDGLVASPSIDLRSLRRKFAAKYHPDRNGCRLAMKAINEVIDEISEMQGA